MLRPDHPVSCSSKSSARGRLRGELTLLDFVTRHVELAVHLSATPETASPNPDIYYQISVSNNGPHQAADVTLIDEPPSGVSFLSASATQGTCAESSGTVTCELGDMAENSSVYVDIVANVTSASGTTLENTASVSHTTTDPDPPNNTATISTDVLVSADVSAFGTVEPYWVSSTGHVRAANRKSVFENPSSTLRRLASSLCAPSVNRFFSLEAQGKEKLKAQRVESMLA